jgi:ubiquinone/menaquinone biosynthesis C-methylase UbiE
MNAQIRLLDASYLADNHKLKELTHWLRVMNRPNGWHYDLDHIWILNEIESAGILPGATIVDAGAGQGVMQYFLAARGYNVISLDFSSRKIPARSKGIFQVAGEGGGEIAYQHPYMSFINYDARSNIQSFLKRLQFRKLHKLPELPTRISRQAYEYAAYLMERYFGQHNSFGSITYVRAPFHEVPLDEGITDAVISVSAIEHADITLFDKNITSLYRLLKPGAPMLLTTSATAENRSFYDNKVQGWCYSKDDLSNYFPNASIDFKAAECESSLLASKIFMNRLDPYYYLDSGSPFYKRNFKSLPYLPVAIKVLK